MNIINNDILSEKCSSHRKSRSPLPILSESTTCLEENNVDTSAISNSLKRKFEDETVLLETQQKKNNLDISFCGNILL